MPRRRRLISCPETKIAAKRREQKRKGERKREKKLKRENSARGIKTSLLAPWPLIVENDTRILVPRERTKFVYVWPNADVVAEVASVWECTAAVFLLKLRAGL